MNFKIVLIGNQGVGKTCILERFAFGIYNESKMATLGVDMCEKTITLSEGGLRVKLRIWDTAGQEIYRSLSSLYYRDADAVVIVYDVTNKGSYEHLVAYWLKEIKNHAKEGCLVTIVGNKVDMAIGFDFDVPSVSALAQQYNAKMLFSSAKDNINIKEIFLDLAARKFPELSATPKLPCDEGQQTRAEPDLPKVRLRNAQCGKRKRRTCC